MKVSSVKENKQVGGKGSQRKKREGQEQNYTTYIKIASES